MLQGLCGKLVFTLQAFRTFIWLKTFKKVQHSIAEFIQHNIWELLQWHNLAFKPMRRRIRFGARIWTWIVLGDSVVQLNFLEELLIQVSQVQNYCFRVLSRRNLSILSVDIPRWYLGGAQYLEILRIMSDMTSDLKGMSMAIADYTVSSRAPLTAISMRKAAVRSVSAALWV